MHIYVLELRFYRQLIAKAYRVFLIIFHFFYFCMPFVYFYTIYKRIISGLHEWDTFTTLTILG